MNRLSPEQEKQKRAIFDSMSARNQKKILNKGGYDNWDPFQLPNDPIDIRMDRKKNTAITLVKRFLQECSHEEYNNAYGQGAWEICAGLIKGSDRYKGMHDFSCWYKSFLENGINHE